MSTFTDFVGCITWCLRLQSPLRLAQTIPPLSPLSSPGTREWDMTENNGRPSSASNREVEQDKVYEPIAARQSTNNINGSNSVSLSKTQSRASRRSGALYRTRSQNGYGVADHEPDEDEEAQAGQLEKDPFEVGWDGADDPLCPRSFSKGRKWMITFIVSGCSFCV